MSPDIIINDGKGNQLASVHISRNVAMAAALVLATEVGSPKIAVTKELAELDKIADAFDIAARYHGKRKSKKNP